MTICARAAAGVEETTRRAAAFVQEILPGTTVSPKACQAGPERTSALDRERTPASSVVIGKTKNARVSLAIRDRLEDHTAAAHVDDGE